MIVQALLLAGGLARLVPHSQDIEVRVFYRGLVDAVYLAVGEGDESIALIDLLDKEKMGLDFVLVEPSTNRYSVVVEELLGLTPAMLPAVVFVQGSTRYKYLHERGQITADSIRTLIAQARAGQTPVYLKSEPLPEGQPSAVHKVVGRTVKEYTQAGSTPVLLDIYSPQCGHCKELEPHFLAAAEALAAQGKKVILAKLDYTKNDAPIVEITGFPMLVFFGTDKSLPPVTPRIPLRTKEDIISFVNKNLERTASDNRADQDL
jgi:thiol:disulfide interchange protein